MPSTHHAGGTTRDIEIGNEPPLIGAGRRRAPDRREVSLRWLSGTTLTGFTSTLLMGAALFAALDGRDYVVPDDIKALATAVLRHRLILSAAAEIEGREVEGIVDDLIESTEAPR